VTGWWGDTAAVAALFVLALSWMLRRRANRAEADAKHLLAAAEALHETTIGWFTKLGGMTTPMDSSLTPRAFTAADRALAVVHTGRIYPPGHYATIRLTGTMPAPNRVADGLNIARGSDVVFRTRTTFDSHHQPESMSTSWFHAAACLEKCPALLVTDRIVGGTAAYVATNTGRHGPVSGVDYVAAGTATDDEAHELRIEPGAAVLRIRCTWVASDGTALEYGESVQPADRWGAYRYELPGAL
jgi:hypothetical protein